MRILFIITRADTVGGAQIHVRDLAKALLAQGHDVLVMTGLGSPYQEALQQFQIPHQICPTLKREIGLHDLQAIGLLRQFIRRFQPDLVSTHSSKAGILGRLVCASLGVSCLFTAHGWAFTTGVPEPTRTVYRWIEKLVEPLSDRIICVSDYDRQLGLQAGMSGQRLVTIHNGMPDIPPKLHAVQTAEPPTQILMVGRFERQKDHDTLLRAFQTVSGASLSLVGDGPQLKAMQGLATELGIAERVEFLGYRTDVGQLMSLAHLFVLISHWEGFPRTTLEAMRAALPVLVSDVGGAAEAVVEGETGYCVPQGDVATLRARLKVLVADAELRQNMGQAARQRYEQEFTFERMLQKTVMVYQQVVDSSH